MTSHTPNQPVNSMQKTQSERRRFSRVPLAREQFRHAGNGKIFLISDLTEQGMGIKIIDPEDLILFTAGSRFEGIVNLDGEKCSVSVFVRHVNRHWVGCEFIELNPEVKQSIRSYLDPERLGKSMSLRPSLDGSLWYHGAAGAEFWIWQHGEGEFRSLALVMHGLCVFFEDQELKTGKLISNGKQSESRGIFSLDSSDFELDLAPSSEKLGIAKRLILSSNLSVELKKKCISVLTIEGHHGS